MGVEALAVLRFGLFVLDCETGELTKNGHRVALRPQAARVLTALASRAGQLLSRDDLRREVWGAETYVDFEHGLNLCIQEIRAALHDDATNPRFVQTLPRRGYRFIAPVASGAAPVASPDPVAPDVNEESIDVEPAVAKRSPVRPAVIAVAVLFAAVLVVVFESRKAAAHHTAVEAPRSASIALLPLKTFGTSDDDRNLATGLTLELTKHLGRVESLRVISPGSTAQYKDSKEPTARIARDLSVTNVLSGSVRRTGDRFRMNLTLADGRTGTRVWSGSYDSDLTEAFDTEKDVARAVASSLDLRLTSSDEQRLRHARPIDAKAHAAFLAALAARTPADFQGKLEQAVALDPNFSNAWSTMAQMYVNRGWFSQTDSPVVTYAKAKEYAQRAIAIDDNNSTAHAVLAAVKLHHEWDWPGAEREFRRAIETGPSDANAHHIYSHYLLAMDRLRESVAESRKATELDPLSPHLSTCVGWHCLYARQYDEAVAQCLSLVNQEKASDLTYYYLGRVYARRGEMEPAIAALEVAVTKSGGLNAVLATVGQVYGRAGRRADAEHVLSILTERQKKGYVAALDFAVVYAGLGDSDKTFEWLDKAYMERSVWLVHLKWDERFISVRKDPRFPALLRRIGLPAPDNVTEPERPVPVTKATRMASVR